MRDLASSRSGRWALALTTISALLPACTALTGLDGLRFDRPEDAATADAPEPSDPDADDRDADDPDDGSVGSRCVEGAECDDGDACTDDQCVEGRCTASPIECPDDDDDPCTRAHCSPEVGCGLVGLPDGEPCDDGSLCTRGERCIEAVCTAEETTACRVGVEPCREAVCDPATGGCTTVPSEPGRACDDGDACTHATVCQADGSCGGGIGCGGDDGNPCTTRLCDPGRGCVDAPVTDGAGCGAARSCCGGACVATDGDPRHCGGCGQACGSPSAPSCVRGACAACVSAADCADDGLDCTEPPTCGPDGRCEHAIVLGACLIDGMCRVDGERDPLDDCRGCNGYSSPTRWVALQDVGCDDGLFCTIADWCESGVCMGGAPIRCDDHNACTIEVCDEIADTCGSSVLPDGSDCGWRSTCCAGSCGPSLCE
ncbi:MAG: hypothetical protein IT379_25595 [Deltaproteobacteria bacterium]|nr:hypothetical protein [Deltaproteobacteria bacterium]